MSFCTDIVRMRMTLYACAHDECKLSKYVRTYTINITCLLSMATEDSWCRFFTVVASLLRECERSTGSRDINKIENICERLERCVCNVQRLHRLAVQTVNGMEVERVLFNLLQQISTAMLPFWRQKREEFQTLPRQAVCFGGSSLQRNPSQRGRPPYIISEEQILFLRELQFTWRDISGLLGVSRMTLYRRRRDLGLLEHDR